MADIPDRVTVLEMELALINARLAEIQANAVSREIFNDRLDRVDRMMTEILRRLDERPT